MIRHSTVTPAEKAYINSCSYLLLNSRTIKWDLHKVIFAAVEVFDFNDLTAPFLSLRQWQGPRMTHCHTNQVYIWQEGANRCIEELEIYLCICRGKKTIWRKSLLWEWAPLADSKIRIANMMPTGTSVLTEIPPDAPQTLLPYLMGMALNELLNKSVGKLAWWQRKNIISQCGLYQ